MTAVLQPIYVNVEATYFDLTPEFDTMPLRNGFLYSSQRLPMHFHFGVRGKGRWFGRRCGIGLHIIELH